MAIDRTIKINGEKLARLVNEQPFTTEEFARVIGLQRSGLQRITRKGTQGVYKATMLALSEALKIEYRELKKMLEPEIERDFGKSIPPSPIGSGAPAKPGKPPAPQSQPDPSKKRRGQSTRNIAGDR